MSTQPQKSKVFVYEQHANNNSTKLQTFYQDQLFVDIELRTKTDNFKVHAHRNVLSASSDYFRAMLSSKLKEDRLDVIEVEIDGPTLKLIIDFIYSGTIELCCDNVARIFTAAGFLKMSALKVACSDFIRDTDSISIDVTNWLSIALMAKEQQSAELHKKAFDFALMYFEEVRKNETFLTLTQDYLCEIISSDDLCVDSEESVFQSLVSWVEYDTVNREKCITDLLKHVRFSFLNPEFIKENRHSVCKTMESFELVCSWLESLLTPAKSPKVHSERKKPNKFMCASSRLERETLGFVIGSCTDILKLQTFDSKLNRWSCEDLPPPPTKRTGYRATVINKKLIIAGGVCIDSVCETNIVECLDLGTKEWTKLPPMIRQRTLHRMAELNGDLYVIGGNLNDDWLRSVERYNFCTCEWQQVASMHISQSYVAVTVLGELLYAVGANGFPIECYNPANNKWTQISHKNERSTGFGIAGVGGHLYAVGGHYNEEASSTVECYNPLTDTWKVISPDLKQEFFDLQCTSWNNRLITCGTRVDSQFKMYNSVEEYNPETNEWKTLAPLLFNDVCDGSLFTYIK